MLDQTTAFNSQLKTTVLELEAAKEEIAEKVAQVEAYKQVSWLAFKIFFW